jgi:hypothetical protein
VTLDPNLDQRPDSSHFGWAETQAKSHLRIGKYTEGQHTAVTQFVVADCAIIFQITKIIAEKQGLGPLDA